MSRRFTLILTLLVLSLIGQQVDVLLKSFGIPNIVSLVRELLVFSLFGLALTKYGFFKERTLSVGIIGFLFFSTAYLFISVLEEQFFLGAYYLRVYALPLIFLIISQETLRVSTYEQMQKVIKLIAVSNFILVFIAIALFAYIQVFPDQKIKIFGTGVLPSAWYISGGTFMRMGLPFTAPNSLGIYASLMLLFFLFCYFSFGAKKQSRFLMLTLIVINLLAVLGSLSRSSMIVIIMALFMLPIIPAFRKSTFFFKISIGVLIFLSIASVALFAVELISDGFLSVWFELNFSGKDPSMQGHFTSIVDAIKNFSNYYLYGYPRGTVGPKAAAAGMDFYNVENSTLGTIFDMGLIGAFMFWSIYLIFMAATYRTRLQIIFSVPFFIFMQILPFIFEQEIMSFFLFMYVCIGHLDRVGFFKELIPSNQQKRERI